MEISDTNKVEEKRDVSKDTDKDKKDLSISGMEILRDHRNYEEFLKALGY